MVTLDEQLDLDNVTVADIALSYPSVIYILQKYHLDDRSDNQMRFLTACEQQKVSVEKIWNDMVIASASLGCEGFQAQTSPQGSLVSFAP